MSSFSFPAATYAARRSADGSPPSCPGGLDDFVEVADRAVADGKLSGPSCRTVSFRASRKRPPRSAAVMSSWRRRDQRPLSRHAMYSTTASCRAIGLSASPATGSHRPFEQRDLCPDRQVIRLRLDTIGFELHGPFLRLVSRHSKFADGSPHTLLRNFENQWALALIVLVRNRGNEQRHPLARARSGVPAKKQSATSCRT